MKAHGWLLALLVIAAVAQAWLASRSGLWADEVFSLAMATGHSMEHPAAAARPERGDFVEPERPVSAAELQRYLEVESVSRMGNVLRAVRLSDTSPPLYYLLLHAWVRAWGTSDGALRAFSIAASLACVVLVFWIGRELAGARVAWIGAVLFVAAPLSLYYSTEGRMYPLLWLGVLGMAASSLQLWRDRGGWKVSAAWILTSAAGLLVHYYFLFPWAGAVGALLARRDAPRAKLLLGEVLPVLALVAPWYAQLPELLAQWRITQEWVNWKSSAYTLPQVTWESLVRWFTADGNSLWRPHRKAGAAALGVFAVSAWVMIRRGGGDCVRGERRIVWGCFLAACLGPIAADVLRGSYIAEYPRYASAALPMACVIGAWMLASWRGRWAGAALAAVLVCWTPAIVSVYRSESRSWQPTREAARRVSARAGAEDVVLIQSVPTGALSLTRYLQTPAEIAVWVEQLGQRRVPGSLHALLKGRRAVLSVTLHTVGAAERPESWLRAHARLVREERVGTIAIREFRPAVGEIF